MNFERNRFNSMIILRDRLEELFKLIGVETHRIDVAPQNKALELLELIVRDYALYDYLENLDAQTLLAIRKMKDRNLDAWNSRENEHLLEKMLDEEETNQARIDALEKEKETNIAKINELVREKDTLQHTVNLLSVDLKKAREVSEGLRSCVETLQKEQINIVKSLISMRDTLLMRTNWIADNTPEGTAVARLVATQLQETAQFLENMGVEILEDAGRFDSRSHTVVGTILAASTDQVDLIAQTIRPGYRFHGENIRSQEVIVYVNAQEDT